MARFSLHTVGKDRPGIVAGITTALAKFGANLEETNMTILHGQSAVMLVLEVPNLDDGRIIEVALEQVAEEFNLFVTVCPMPENQTAPTGGESFLISIEGADRPGIVAGVTTALAGLGANVIDLTSRPIERDGQSAYVLRLSVLLPSHVLAASLEETVNAVSEMLQVSHSIRPWTGELAWDNG